MSEYKRLKENIETLYAHNERHIPVFHITGGAQHEIDLIREIVSDCREILNKIEQGTLIELPCKVGDKVYIDERVYRHSVFYNHIIVGIKFLVVGRVTSIRITKKQILMRVKVEYAGNPFRHKEINFPIGAIGKTLFLTREEAEAKLKELQE